MAEGGGLLNRCTGQNLYPGFESLPLRQFSRPQALTLNEIGMFANLLSSSAVPKVSFCDLGTQLLLHDQDLR